MSAKKSSKTVVSVSTKTGDKGTASLANGERVSKASLVFEVIGTLDEVNSWLGYIATRLEHEFQGHRSYVLEIQDTLFYIGAELAQSPKAKLTLAALHKLEKQADVLQETMKDDWHTKFILPGGTELGAIIDISRTVCRRCERLLVRLDDEQHVNPVLIKYINRLSDYLYLLRCFINHALEYPEQEFVAKEYSKVAGKK